MRLLLLCLMSTLALASQNMRLLIFRGDCYEAFFTQHNFTNTECLTLTLSKIVGLSIVAGSFVLKVPQIVKIFKAKSVAGISKSLFYLEIVSLLHQSAYSILKGVAFSIYGDFLIILVQNIIIVGLFWTYSREISAAEKASLTVFFLAYSYLLFSGYRYLSASQWDWIQSTNMAIMVLSKLPQIAQNHRAKSTG